MIEQDKTLTTNVEHFSLGHIDTFRSISNGSKSLFRSILTSSFGRRLVILHSISTFFHVTDYRTLVHERRHSPARLRYEKALDPLVLSEHVWYLACAC